MTETAKYKIDFLKTHTVYKSAAGKRLPGVTTVLGMLDKPALLKWAWNLGRDGIEMERTRDEAASIGTVAHALCEAHLRGMEFDAENVTPTQLAKAQTSFGRFVEWWNREGLTVVATELVMVSEAMQCGGTLDILAKRESGSLVLVDLKTSKAIYDEMLVQAATYAEMYEEIGRTQMVNTIIDEVIVVRIGKEDADDLEIRTVTKRPERVAAFAALANARRLLQAAGMKV